MSYFLSPYSKSVNQPQDEWLSPWRIDQERRREEERLAGRDKPQPANQHKRIWPSRPERHVAPDRCADCGAEIRNGTKFGRCIKHSRRFYKKAARDRKKAAA